MFDYIVVVVGEEREVKRLEHFPWHEDVLQTSILIPVSEGSWNGPAGNGLGTLFAIKNASNAAGKELVEEVKQGKSVLIVHTAGKGTRNILTRTCKEKAFIDVPGLTILEGVIKQFQRFSIPHRIMVTWGDQFLFIADTPESLIECAHSTHVMLFGLKSEFTEEIVSKYGIQIVRCGDKGKGKDKGCELLDFDDTRNYEVVKSKMERYRGSEVLLNLGLFTLSGVLTERLLDAFSDRLEERVGEFNSDELWQLWCSPDSVTTNKWLRERAERLKREMTMTSDLNLIKSFAISDQSIWFDFGTNKSYYRNMMRLLSEGAEAAQLRRFLNVELLSATDGCEILDSIYVNSGIERGRIKRSVVSNTTAKAALLEDACVFNSRLNRINGKNCVVYNLVDCDSVELNDCVLVDVFHPARGRIRLRFPIGKESRPKEEWWSSRLPGNEYTLSEVAAMTRGITDEEMQSTRLRHARLADAIMSMSDTDTDTHTEAVRVRVKVRDMIEHPMKLKPLIVNKPWGYELWCASPRNYIEGEEFTLCELNTFFSEAIFGMRMEEFPLIVKIIKADENLSVQVHPDDRYARKMGDVMGKEEAWYVLEAKEDARIYLGFRDSLRSGEFLELVKRGEILNYMNSFYAQPGDIYHIPAGVIHALGAGTKVYEVSTASERTFRVYDYGRGRELHLNDAMNVLRFEVPRGLKHGGGHLRGKHLDLRLISVHNSNDNGMNPGINMGMDIKNAGVLTCVRGQVTLVGDAKVKLPLKTFETALVPVPATVSSGSASGSGIRLEGEGDLIYASFISS